MFSYLVFEWLWAIVLSWLRHLLKQPPFSRSRASIQQNNTGFRLSQRKPDWVINEIIRLKAYLPNASCRTIAHTFNRLHARSKKMTVSKSYVYTVFIKHGHGILVQRQKIKQRPAYQYGKNQLWQIDLTSTEGERVLGVIDCGTRALLSLEPAKTKRSITLLWQLLRLIDRYGKPTVIRSDNEACFTSRIMRFTLWLIGVKKQTTQVASPWQNGRIERLFGTLKTQIKQSVRLEISTRKTIEEFTLWYNHSRPHQALNGATPAEIWNKQQPNKAGKHRFISYWNGQLNGVYVPPD